LNLSHWNQFEEALGVNAFLDRLCQATNAHDVDAIVACFRDDYRNETPAHPERSFVGSDQVRRNWEMILSAVPDMHAEVTRSVVEGGTVWSEWEQRGTRPDGGSHVMRGVIIFGVEDGLAVSARFYLEPVEQGGGTNNEFIPRQLDNRP
jgi:ketosteroid isomerase-like protein